MEKIWMKDNKFVQLSDAKKEELSELELSAYVVDETKASFDVKIEEAQKGNVKQEDYDTFKTETQNKLNDVMLSDEVKNQINLKHSELIEKLKAQGLDIKALKESNSNLSNDEKKTFESLTRKEQFAYLMKKGMETEDFERFKSGDMRGHTQKLDAKKVSGLASDHTGDVFITESVDNVRDTPRVQPHMRDYISVSQTDETTIAFPEVTDYSDIYTLGTKMLSENEEITDVSFKSEEKTSQVVRLGVSMDVSKRYFRGKSSVIIDHVVSQIPDGLMFKEDVQVLHADGSGNNLKGIITDARAFDLTPKTFVAGNFASVASYDSGKKTLITLNVAHGLLSGDKLTIASATESSYNATHEDIILIDEKSVVINLTYVAEADVSSWTGTGKSYWYQSVDNAQEFDVLSAAASILEAGLYNANVIFVNPQTTRRIGTLKGTDAHYIGVSRNAAGQLNMDGIPIVSMPTIPAGWFLIGDFSSKNIEIRDYSTMSVQFLEDVTTNKTNSVVVLAAEEIHLVKYNPKWYVYDRFSSAKSQLEEA